LTIEKILVTSALPYANGPIHLGHLAGAYLPADIFVRYHRLKGNDVVYICGSDEHGVPIMLRARAEGKTPQEIVDDYHNRNKESFKKFGMSFDYYGRTSSHVHHQTSQDFFRELEAKDIFVLKSEKQLYDPEAKMFLADRFVRGGCPKCRYEEAYGDQCESCGSSLSPLDLIDPHSAITNAKPVLKKTTHWYLPLANFQPKLEDWIHGHPEWKPNVLGQIKSWFNDGLKNRAVTRDLSWGVPVPADSAQKSKTDVEGKVLYVWFDAPIGYISATKEWAQQKGESDLWKDYWQNKNTRLVHFIGKDNIVFHCLIFPAMLMAHGKFVLPDNVPANEFLNLEGNKLSTSRNYAVWLDEYLKKFEPDSLRYCLANNLPETKDTDFSWKDFQARHNNELADILGNFINRTITFTFKNFDGKIPEKGKFSKLDLQLVTLLEKAPQKVGALINSYQIRQALKEIMDLARFANKYFNDKSPWKTIKVDRTSCANTINLCLETIKTLSVLIKPFIPFTSDKIERMLNISEFAGKNIWDTSGELSLRSGEKLNDPEILFDKIEDKKINAEIEKLLSVNLKPLNENKEKMKVTLEDFSKLDLRVAEIIKAEPVMKADKLIKLHIKIAEEKRQIIAGIAQFYKPEELQGKKIIVVANLQPAKIRGELSNGMLLAARDENELVLLTVDNEIDSGAKIS